MFSEMLRQNTVCGYTVLTDAISKEHQASSLISCNLALLHLLYSNSLVQTIQVETVFPLVFYINLLRIFPNRCP